MFKDLRVLILIVLIVVPIVFYKSLSKKNDYGTTPLSRITGKTTQRKPQVALIFDDLGESLSELKELYSLGIPMTVSVIPNLKFSKNIAHIASRCGFSVFIHLPLAPNKETYFSTDKYRFIGSDLSQREIRSLLRKYLNSIRIAIGVNNHMGSKATRNKEVMKIVLGEVKKKGLIFVDSKTSPESIAYAQARSQGLICGYNEAFLDPVDTKEIIKKQMDKIIDKAKKKGRIIAIAHPRKNTIEFLRENLTSIKEKVEFITIKDYFDL